MNSETANSRLPRDVKVCYDCKRVLKRSFDIEQLPDDADGKAYFRKPCELCGTKQPLLSIRVIAAKQLPAS